MGQPDAITSAVGANMGWRQRERERAGDRGGGGGGTLEEKHKMKKGEERDGKKVKLSGLANANDNCQRLPNLSPQVANLDVFRIVDGQRLDTTKCNILG